MLQYKCPDCGTVFTTDKPSCPSCGCPASDCQKVDNNAPQSQQAPAGNSNAGYASNNSNSQANNQTSSDNTGMGYSQTEIDEVLEFGRSTEAESILTTVASYVWKYGKFFSYFIPAVIVVQGISSLVTMIDEGQDGMGALTISVSVVSAIISYFLIRIFYQIMWGCIMLFVNISTTLKRIEINQQKGCH